MNAFRENMLIVRRNKQLGPFQYFAWGGLHYVTRFLNFNLITLNTK